jgi:hypothetical protein
MANRSRDRLSAISAVRWSVFARARVGRVRCVRHSMYACRDTRVAPPAECRAIRGTVCSCLPFGTSIAPTALPSTFPPLTQLLYSTPSPAYMYEVYTVPPGGRSASPAESSVPTPPARTPNVEPKATDACADLDPRCSGWARSSPDVHPSLGMHLSYLGYGARIRIEMSTYISAQIIIHPSGPHRPISTLSTAYHRLDSRPFIR